MSRPAYIIGLGGTGQWILTYLKKELTEINKGYMPNRVKLLSIDTQLQDVQLAGVDKDTASSRNLTNAQVGSVRLDSGTEFVQIGSAQLYKVIKSQQQKPQDYLSWLDVDRLLKLGEGNCSTLLGAGAFRQLGRLSLFNSVTNVYSRLRQDLTDLKKTLTEKEPLEILVTGSIAGGTGAGTLLDIAWLLRTAAEEVQIEGKWLRAFIVLPTAFEKAAPESNKRLRAYAAWKELDRFMNSAVAVKGVSKIVYNPNSIPPLEAKCDTSIFDTTYLVDPNRGGSSGEQPITGVNPEDGCFPAIAQAISLILDERVGSNYAKHVPNVHMGGASSLPDGTYHSAFGTYTIKIPVQFMRSQQGRELAFASIEKWLEPVISDTGVGTDARFDKNMEVQPNDIPSGVMNLLISSQQGNVNSTMFPRHIDAIARKGAAYQKYCADESRVAVTRRGETMNGFIDMLNNVELAREAAQIKNEHVFNVVLTAQDKNMTPAKNYPIVMNDVGTKEGEWFGQRQIVSDPQHPNNQVEVRVGQGSRNRFLQRVKNHQIENFREILRAWSTVQLNGYTQQNNVVARSGKLGYVYKIYEELENQFGRYETFLLDLKRLVDRENYKGKCLRDVEGAGRNYYSLANRESIISPDKVYPRAWEAEREFLRKVDRLFDYFYFEAWIGECLDAIRQMRLFTANSRAELTRQKRLLISGKNDDKPEYRYQGLYNYAFDMIRQGANGLDMEINQGNPNFVQNHNLQGVQQLIQTQVAQKHYQDIDRMTQIRQVPVRISPYNPDINIDTILKTLVWEVRVTQNGVALEYQCGFYVPATEDVPAHMNYFDSAETKDAIHNNYELWLKNAQGFFGNIEDSTTLDTQIAKDFPNPASLADSISLWSAPLYQPKMPAATGPFDRSMFIRINDVNNRQYFKQFKDRVNDIAPNYQIGLVDPNTLPDEPNSQDNFKLTVFRAHHLMPSTDFALMNDMEDLFVTVMNKPEGAANPVQNFVFAAEKNAHHYAMLKPSLLDQDYRPFSPEVVNLLEDETKLIMFIMAYAQGVLKREKVIASKAFSWKVPSLDLTLVDASDKLGHPKPLAIFDVIRSWMKGEDARKGKTHVHGINWPEMEKALVNKTKKDLVKVRKEYEYQLTDKPDTILSVIRADKVIQYDLVEENTKIYFQSEKYQDLEDLTRIILMQTIEDMK